MTVSCMADEKFTQVPNYIIDGMATMYGSTFAVVMLVVRQTVGWQKEWDKISTTQFQQKTGLSRQGVLNAIADAVARGWIEQRHVGQQAWEYKLTGNAGQPVEKEKSATSQLSRPVNSVDQSTQLTSTSQLSRPEPVNSVDPQKKERKRKKDISSAPPTDEGKTLTEQQQWFDALCKVCRLDYNVISEKERGKVAQTIRILRKADYTLDHLRQFYRWWYSEDWRGKNGQPPTLEQVRQYIGQFKVGVTLDGEMSSNGNGGMMSPVFNGSEK